MRENLKLLAELVDNGTADTSQVAALINLALAATSTELFINSFNEVVVAQGYDEVVLR